LTSTTNDMVNDLRRLVEIESPSSDVASLHRCADVLLQIAESRTSLAVTRTENCGRPVVRIGPDDASILLLGHLDTVHPIGTIERNPCERVGDVMTGPGILDMKSGLVIALHALAETEDAALLVTADEELGSPDSRAGIEAAARWARAVLVVEPAAESAVKVARKGVARFTVNFRGRAAHAGLEPEKGANALIAMARALIEVESMGDIALGTTVTPTLSSAGTTINTVPETAMFTVDSRAWTADEQQRVQRCLTDLTSAVPGVIIDVEAGSHRPPFERTLAESLLRIAQDGAGALGQPPLEAVSVGGGSDGNFTAALGIPTLDGLGGVGGGAHAIDEWVSVSSLALRSTLLHEIIQRIAALRSVNLNPPA
jgi:glutamate carboxypeptidase